MITTLEQTVKKIGERLRNVRETRGKNMTIAREIRERYGVKIDPSYLSRMERGKAEIPLRTLFALADYYEVEVASLLHSAQTGDATDIEYILSDPDLVRTLTHLKLELGENLARHHIKRSIEQLLELRKDRKPEPG